MHSLALHGDSADVLLPAAAALSQLTQLIIHDIAASTAASKLKWIPKQLQQLHLSLARIRKSEALPALNLGRLTALTQLTSDGKPLVLQEADVLPQSLRVLRVRDCLVAAPLLPLTQLQVCRSSQANHLSAVPVVVCCGWHAEVVAAALCIPTSQSTPREKM